MTANGWFQILLFFAVLLAVTKPLGVFMTRVFSREKTFLDPVLRPIERLIYRCCGIDETHEMDWKEYAIAMLLFSVVSMLVLYLIERVQSQVAALESATFRDRGACTSRSIPPLRSRRTRTGRTTAANRR